MWFVNKAFFVVLDEAIGEAPGALDLHFHFAPGDARIDTATKSAKTLFEDANVLVWAGPEAPVTIEEEQGWFAWKYGQRTERPAFRLRHESPAPAAYLTLVVPYRGAKTPEVAAQVPAGHVVGTNRVELTATVGGQTWRFGRDLSDGTAWCTKD